MRALRLSLLVLCLLPLTAAMVQARGSSLMWRFYYGQAFHSELAATPSDPDGDEADTQPKQVGKGELELILWQRAGINLSREVVLREFDAAPGLTATEEWLQYLGSLTLYALPVEHNSFNLFAGIGNGYVEKYTLRLNGTMQTVPAAHKSMNLHRTFGGVEYTWERIGFRLEIARMTGEKTADGIDAELDQTHQYLTLVIPLN